MVGANIKMRHFQLRKYLILSTLLFVVMTSAIVARAAADSVLFEAYYSVKKAGAHVGYYIMKHEYDSKKKQFTATTFMKIEGDEGITETIKAVADDKFFPVSFSYTAMGSGQTRTVDAKVSNSKLQGSIVANGKTEKVSLALKKGSISSLFLIYAILRSPDGLKAKTNFNYTAIAEELAQETTGTVEMKDFEQLGGQKVLRLENTFLGTKSDNFVNEKGEVISTLSPTQKISIEIAPTPAQALGKFQAQNSLLKSLFGEIPAGTKNSVSGKAGL